LIRRPEATSAIDDGLDVVFFVIAAARFAGVVRPFPFTLLRAADARAAVFFAVFAAGIVTHRRSNGPTTCDFLEREKPEPGV
jgi:hypothetical protein